MSEAALNRRLEKERSKVRILEQMLEDKTRALFLQNEELTGKNAYLARLKDGIPSAVMVVNGNDVIQDVNSAAARELRLPPNELVGRRLAEFSLPPPANDGKRDSADDHREETWKRADGSFATMLVSEAEIESTSSATNERLYIGFNISQRRALEAELESARKLEGIGQLASGIAHEINTPMQFIGDNVVFLQEGFEDLNGLIQAYRDQLAKLPLTDELKKELLDAEEDADLEYLQERMPSALERALNGVERVRKIVQGMKEFGHQGEEAIPIDVNRTIESTLDVCRNEYKYVANIDLELENVPMVSVIPGRLHQVVMNLVVNGAHAIEDLQREERGHITIRSFFEGGDVVVTIRDDGGGIPEEVANRIFEPFFTTKAVGRGTGQGLPIVRRLVKDMGGDLRFETEIGQGTTFYVSVPAIGGEGGEKL